MGPPGDDASASSAPDLAARIASYPFWYHRIDLGNGVVTPGEWDHPAIHDRIPWPEVAGLRCLDVATCDGYYAFEMERRGAAEVVATDIASWDQVDRNFDQRVVGDPFTTWLADTEWHLGGGFTIAKEAIGSKVEWRNMSIYDLSPETVGLFDVVICGSLLLHLRDPIAALEAIRSVCRGQFLSVEAVDPLLTLMHRGVPTARFLGSGSVGQWWNANAACHSDWLVTAGFDVKSHTRMFVLPRKASSPRPSGGGRRGLVRRVTARALTGMPAHGVVHRAVLAETRA